METTASKNKTLIMCMCAMFTALIAVGAFIKIPVPVVPFTLQYLFTMMAGLLLGAKRGAMSVIVYIILGLIGLPIFAEGGGPQYVLMPSFGYMIGFAVGTYVTGFIAHKEKNPSHLRLLAANLAGLGIVYLMGMIYYYVAANIWGNGIGLKALFIYCFVMVVPGDIVLCITAMFIGKRLIPVTEKYRQ